MPAAAAWLEAETPGLDLRLTEAEPPEALRMLRAGYVDVALVFQHYQEDLDDAPPKPTEEGTRGRLIMDEPVHLVTRTPGHVAEPGWPRAARPKSARPGTRPAPPPAATGQADASAPAGDSNGGPPDLTRYADSRWIAGCERCRSYLVRQCEATFTVTKVSRPSPATMSRLIGVLERTAGLAAAHG